MQKATIMTEDAKKLKEIIDLKEQDFVKKYKQSSEGSSKLE